jgi:hypothetical protein
MSLNGFSLENFPISSKEEKKNMQIYISLLLFQKILKIDTQQLLVLLVKQTTNIQN